MSRSLFTRRSARLRRTSLAVNHETCYTARMQLPIRYLNATYVEDEDRQRVTTRHVLLLTGYQHGRMPSRAPAWIYSSPSIHRALEFLVPRAKWPVVVEQAWAEAGISPAPSPALIASLGRVAGRYDTPGVRELAGLSIRLPKIDHQLAAEGARKLGRDPCFNVLYYNPQLDLIPDVGKGPAEKRLRARARMRATPMLASTRQFSSIMWSAEYIRQLPREPEWTLRTVGIPFVRTYLRRWPGVTKIKPWRPSYGAPPRR